MKTEVILCDICKRRLAHHKCEICNNDICDNCKSHIGIYNSNTDFLLTLRKMSYSGIMSEKIITMCETCVNSITINNDQFKKGSNISEPIILDLVKLLRLYKTAVIV